MSDDRRKLVEEARAWLRVDATRAPGWETYPAPDVIIRRLADALEDATDEIAVLREAGREQDGALRDMEKTVKMQHRALRDA